MPWPLDILLGSHWQPWRELCLAFLLGFACTSWLGDCSCCADGCANTYTVTFDHLTYAPDGMGGGFFCDVTPTTSGKTVAVTRPNCTSAWVGTSGGYTVTINAAKTSLRVDWTSPITGLPVNTSGGSSGTGCPDDRSWSDHACTNYPPPPLPGGSEKIANVVVA